MSKSFEREAVPVIQKALKVMFTDEESLSVEEIAKIVWSDHPMDAFLNCIQKRERAFGIRELFPFLDFSEIAILCRYADEAENWLRSQKCDIPRFLSQQVEVNLILATMSEAFDNFRACARLNRWGGAPDEDCALLRVAQILGCKDSLLRIMKDPRYLFQANGAFVETAVDELAAFSNTTGALTVLTRMSLGDLIELQTRRQTGDGYLIVGRNARMGIFDPWHGGGSHLGIEPDRPFTIPVSFIWDVWVEGMKAHGQDIGDVYRIGKSAWREDAVRLEPVAV